MAPIEYESWPSKIGFQVVPELTVFQTPPEPTATYQTLGLSGCNAMSAMRPDMNAGPMVRSSSPANVLSVSASCAESRWPNAFSDNSRQTIATPNRRADSRIDWFISGKLRIDCGTESGGRTFRVDGSASTIIIPAATPNARRPGRSAVAREPCAFSERFQAFQPRFELRLEGPPAPYRPGMQRLAHLYGADGVHRPAIVEKPQAVFLPGKVAELEQAADFAFRGAHEVFVDKIEHWRVGRILAALAAGDEVLDFVHDAVHRCRKGHLRPDRAGEIRNAYVARIAVHANDARAGKCLSDQCQQAEIDRLLVDQSARAGGAQVLLGNLLNFVPQLRRRFRQRCRPRDPDRQIGHVRPFAGSGKVVVGG